MSDSSSSSSPSGQEVVVGIDLGTKNCRVGFWDNGRVEFFLNEEGSPATPSVVSFLPDEVLVGSSARARILTHPDSTVFGVSRFAGKRFATVNRSPEFRYWPFSLQDRQERPHVEIPSLGCFFAPEELLAHILNQMMRNLVETHPETKGKELKGAVIAVPSHFTTVQRESVLQAAQIAGLPVLRLVNSTTAAAFAFGKSEHVVNVMGEEAESRVVFVVDAGAGKCDVAILEIEDGIFEVKATTGGSREGSGGCGGMDLDLALAEFVLQGLRARGVVVEEMETGFLSKVLLASEKAREELSSAERTVVDVHIGEEFQTQISRTEMAAICGDLYQTILNDMRDCLEASKIWKRQVNDIVLVGGLSEDPLLRKHISDFFDGMAISEVLDPLTAVAHGASILAASEIGTYPVRDFLILDVIPNSLGIETAGGVMTALIPRLTTIPCCKRNTFTTYCDSAQPPTVPIFEGEASLTRDCAFLGSFRLSGMRPAPVGVPKIEMTFRIDVSGILSVSGRDSVDEIDLRVSWIRRPVLGVDELAEARKRFEERERVG